MQASHQGHEMCSCPIIGDAKSDHMVKADAHEIPTLAKVPFFPLKLLSRVWSGPVKLSQGPDRSTNLHQWLWHVEHSCLNQLLREELQTDDFLIQFFLLILSILDRVNVLETNSRGHYMTRKTRPGKGAWQIKWNTNKMGTHCIHNTTMGKSCDLKYSGVYSKQATGT